MIEGATLVVDIGKTHAKLSLWDPAGSLVGRWLRVNDARWSAAGYRALDVEGIEQWLLETLADFSGNGSARRIVAVGHGAAAALIRGGVLFADPMDYEEDSCAEGREAYDRARDPFSATGSPALPLGLNLGVQLDRIETLLGPLPEDVTIVPWAQFWSWRLSGIAASEVTSLGCHSDLWRPLEGGFSALALQRGWAARMAPVRRASEVLGAVLPEIALRTGLGPECAVLCGMHDSNASLLAARGHPEIAKHEATVLSTGTWFVAMRTPGMGATVDMHRLDEFRDCLVNVDVQGGPIPSARFMGGREFEAIAEQSAFDVNADYPPASLLDRLPGLIESGARLLPSFVAGVGPFPASIGRWRNRPSEAIDRYVAAQLYLALMADVSIGLIGGRDRLLLEGRFATAVAFVRALATLRSDLEVYVSHAEHDVAYGALRLSDPDVAPPSVLTPVEPLELDLRAYGEKWRQEAGERPDQTDQALA